MQSIVQTYHTGAGTADITFVAGKDNGVDAYFNATHLLFDFHISPGQGGQFFPYAMDLDYSTYSAWGPVTASPGEGDYNAGFVYYINCDMIDERITNIPQFFSSSKQRDRNFQ